MVVLEWLAMVLAVVGVVCNNHRKIVCFPLWVISNLACLILHAQAGMAGLAVRDLIFTVLAFHGWYLWRAKDRRTVGDRQDTWDVYNESVLIDRVNGD